MSICSKLYWVIAFCVRFFNIQIWNPEHVNSKAHNGLYTYFLGHVHCRTERMERYYNYDDRTWLLEKLFWIYYIIEQLQWLWFENSQLNRWRLPILIWPLVEIMSDDKLNRISRWLFRPSQPSSNRLVYYDKILKCFIWVVLYICRWSAAFQLELSLTVKSSLSRLAYNSNAI